MPAGGNRCMASCQASFRRPDAALYYVCKFVVMETRMKPEDVMELQPPKLNVLESLFVPAVLAGLGTTTSAIWKPRFFGFGAFLGLLSQTSLAVFRFRRRGAPSATPSSSGALG